MLHREETAVESPAYATSEYKIKIVFFPYIFAHVMYTVCVRPVPVYNRVFQLFAATLLESFFITRTEGRGS